MLYRLSLFFIVVIFSAGCSSQKLDINYDWQRTNKIIYNKIIVFDNLKIREIKYYFKSKRNWKDGTISYTDKEDRYLYIDASEELNIKTNSLEDIARKSKMAILFKADEGCKDSDYPCSFRCLRLKGEVYKNSVKDEYLSRELILSSPIQIDSEAQMRQKVFNFIKQKG